VDSIALAGRRAHKRVQGCSLLLTAAQLSLVTHRQLLLSKGGDKYKAVQPKSLQRTGDLLKALKHWQRLISFRALD